MSPEVAAAYIAVSIDVMYEMIHTGKISFVPKGSAVCVFNESHVRSSIIVGIRASGAFYYRCLHNGCVGNDWEKFRARVEFDSGKKMKFGVPDNRVHSWIQSDEKALAAWNAQGDLEAGFGYLHGFMRDRRVDIDQWLRLYEASPLKLALDVQIPEYIRNS